MRRVHSVPSRGSSAMASRVGLMCPTDGSSLLSSFATASIPCGVLVTAQRSYSPPPHGGRGGYRGRGYRGDRGRGRGGRGRGDFNDRDGAPSFRPASSGPTPGHHSSDRAHQRRGSIDRFDDRQSTEPWRGRGHRGYDRPSHHHRSHSHNYHHSASADTAAARDATPDADVSRAGRFERSRFSNAERTTTSRRLETETESVDGLGEADDEALYVDDDAALSHSQQTKASSEERFDQSHPLSRSAGSTTPWKASNTWGASSWSNATEKEQPEQTQTPVPASSRFKQSRGRQAAVISDADARAARVQFEQMHSAPRVGGRAEANRVNRALNSGPRLPSAEIRVEVKCLFDRLTDLRKHDAAARDTDEQLFGRARTEAEVQRWWTAERRAIAADATATLEDAIVMMEVALSKFLASRPRTAAIMHALVSGVARVPAAAATGGDVSEIASSGPAVAGLRKWLDPMGDLAIPAASLDDRRDASFFADFTALTQQLAAVLDFQRVLQDACISGCPQALVSAAEFSDISAARKNATRHMSALKSVWRNAAAEMATQPEKPHAANSSTSLSCGDEPTQEMVRSAMGFTHRDGREDATAAPSNSALPTTPFGSELNHLRVPGTGRYEPVGDESFSAFREARHSFQTAEVLSRRVAAYFVALSAVSCGQATPIHPSSPIIDANANLKDPSTEGDACNTDTASCPIAATECVSERENHVPSAAPTEPSVAGAVRGHHGDSESVWYRVHFPTGTSDLSELTVSRDEVAAWAAAATVPASVAPMRAVGRLAIELFRQRKHYIQMYPFPRRGDLKISAAPNTYPRPRADDTANSLPEKSHDEISETHGIAEEAQNVSGAPNRSDVRDTAADWRVGTDVLDLLVAQVSDAKTKAKTETTTSEGSGDVEWSHALTPYFANVGPYSVVHRGSMLNPMEAGLPQSLRSAMTAIAEVAAAGERMAYDNSVSPPASVPTRVAVSSSSNKRRDAPQHGDGAGLSVEMQRHSRFGTLHYFTQPSATGAATDSLSSTPAPVTRNEAVVEAQRNAAIAQALQLFTSHIVGRALHATLVTFFDPETVGAFLPRAFLTGTGGMTTSLPMTSTITGAVASDRNTESVARVVIEDAALVFSALARAKYPASFLRPTPSQDGSTTQALAQALKCTGAPLQTVNASSSPDQVLPSPLQCVFRTEAVASTAAQRYASLADIDRLLDFVYSAVDAEGVSTITPDTVTMLMFSQLFPMKTNGDGNAWQSLDERNVSHKTSNGGEKCDANDSSFQAIAAALGPALARMLPGSTLGDVVSPAFGSGDGESDANANSVAPVHNSFLGASSGLVLRMRLFASASESRGALLQEHLNVAIFGRTIPPVHTVLSRDRAARHAADAREGVVSADSPGASESAQANQTQELDKGQQRDAAPNVETPPAVDAQATADVKTDGSIGSKHAVDAGAIDNALRADMESSAQPTKTDTSSSEEGPRDLADVIASSEPNVSAAVTVPVSVHTLLLWLTANLPAFRSGRVPAIFSVFDAASFIADDARELLAGIKRGIHDEIISSRRRVEGAIENAARLREMRRLAREASEERGAETNDLVSAVERIDDDTDHQQADEQPPSHADKQQQQQASQRSITETLLNETQGSPADDLRQTRVVTAQHRFFNPVFVSPSPTLQRALPALLRSLSEVHTALDVVEWQVFSACFAAIRLDLPTVYTTQSLAGDPATPYRGDGAEGGDGSPDHVTGDRRNAPADETHRLTVPRVDAAAALQILHGVPAYDKLTLNQRREVTQLVTFLPAQVLRLKRSLDKPSHYANFVERTVRMQHQRNIVRLSAAKRAAKRDLGRQRRLLSSVTTHDNVNPSAASAAAAVGRTESDESDVIASVDDMTPPSSAQTPSTMAHPAQEGEASIGGGQAPVPALVDMQSFGVDPTTLGASSAAAQFYVREWTLLRKRSDSTLSSLSALLAMPRPSPTVMREWTVFAVLSTLQAWCGMLWLHENESRVQRQLARRRKQAMESRALRRQLAAQLPASRAGVKSEESLLTAASLDGDDTAGIDTPTADESEAIDGHDAAEAGESDVESDMEQSETESSEEAQPGLKADAISSDTISSSEARALYNDVVDTLRMLCSCNDEALSLTQSEMWLQEQHDREAQLMETSIAATGTEVMMTDGGPAREMHRRAVLFEDMSGFSPDVASSSPTTRFLAEDLSAEEDDVSTPETRASSFHSLFEKGAPRGSAPASTSSGRWNKKGDDDEKDDPFLCFDEPNEKGASRVGSDRPATSKIVRNLAFVLPATGLAERRAAYRAQKLRSTVFNEDDGEAQQSHGRLSQALERETAAQDRSRLKTLKLLSRAVSSTMSILPSLPPGLHSRFVTLNPETPWGERRRRFGGGRSDETKRFGAREYRKKIHSSEVTDALHEVSAHLFNNGGCVHVDSPNPANDDHTSSADELSSAGKSLTDDVKVKEEGSNAESADVATHRASVTVIEPSRVVAWWQDRHTVANLCGLLHVAVQQRRTHVDHPAMRATTQLLSLQSRRSPRDLDHHQQDSTGDQSLTETTGGSASHERDGGHGSGSVPPTTALVMMWAVLAPYRLAPSHSSSLFRRPQRGLHSNEDAARIGNDFAAAEQERSHRHVTDSAADASTIGSSGGPLDPFAGKSPVDFLRSRNGMTYEDASSNAALKGATAPFPILTALLDSAVQSHRVTSGYDERTRRDASPGKSPSADPANSVSSVDSPTSARDVDASSEGGIAAGLSPEERQDLVSFIRLTLLGSTNDTTKQHETCDAPRQRGPGLDHQGEGELKATADTSVLPSVFEIEEVVDAFDTYKRKNRATGNVKPFAQAFIEVVPSSVLQLLLSVACTLSPPRSPSSSSPATSSSSMSEEGQVFTPREMESIMNNFPFLDLEAAMQERNDGHLAVRALSQSLVPETVKKSGHSESCGASTIRCAAAERASDVWSPSHLRSVPLLCIVSTLLAFNLDTVGNSHLGELKRSLNMAVKVLLKDFTLARQEDLKVASLGAAEIDDLTQKCNAGVLRVALRPCDGSPSTSTPNDKHGSEGEVRSGVSRLCGLATEWAWTNPPPSFLNVLSEVTHHPFSSDPLVQFLNVPKRLASQQQQSSSGSHSSSAFDRHHHDPTKRRGQSNDGEDDADRDAVSSSNSDSSVAMRHSLAVVLSPWLLQALVPPTVLGDFLHWKRQNTLVGLQQAFAKTEEAAVLARVAALKINALVTTANGVLSARHSALETETSSSSNAPLSVGDAPATPKPSVSREEDSSTSCRPAVHVPGVLQAPPSLSPLLWWLCSNLSTGRTISVSMAPLILTLAEAVLEDARTPWQDHGRTLTTLLRVKDELATSESARTPETIRVQAGLDSFIASLRDGMSEKGIGWFAPTVASPSPAPGAAGAASSSGVAATWSSGAATASPATTLVGAESVDQENNTTAILSENAPAPMTPLAAAASDQGHARAATAAADLDRARLLRRQREQFSKINGTTLNDKDLPTRVTASEARELSTVENEAVVTSDPALLSLHDRMLAFDVDELTSRLMSSGRSAEVDEAVDLVAKQLSPTRRYTETIRLCPNEEDLPDKPNAVSPNAEKVSSKSATYTSIMSVPHVTAAASASTIAWVMPSPPLARGGGNSGGIGGDGSSPRGRVAKDRASQKSAGRAPSVLTGPFDTLDLIALIAVINVIISHLDRLVEAYRSAVLKQQKRESKQDRHKKIKNPHLRKRLGLPRSLRDNSELAQEAEVVLPKLRTVQRKILGRYWRVLAVDLGKSATDTPQENVGQQSGVTKGGLPRGAEAAGSASAGRAGGIDAALMSGDAAAENQAATVIIQEATLALAAVASQDLLRDHEKACAVDLGVGAVEGGSSELRDDAGSEGTESTVRSSQVSSPSSPFLSAASASEALQRATVAAAVRVASPIARFVGDKSASSLTTHSAAENETKSNEEMTYTWDMTFSDGTDPNARGMMSSVRTTGMMDHRPEEARGKTPAFPTVASALALDPRYAASLGAAGSTTGRLSSLLSEGEVQAFNDRDGASSSQQNDQRADAASDITKKSGAGITTPSAVTPSVLHALHDPCGTVTVGQLRGEVAAIRSWWDYSKTAHGTQIDQAPLSDPPSTSSNQSVSTAARSAQLTDGSAVSGLGAPPVSLRLPMDAVSPLPKLLRSMAAPYASHDVRWTSLVMLLQCNKFSLSTPVGQIVTFFGVTAAKRRIKSADLSSPLESDVVDAVNEMMRLQHTAAAYAARKRSLRKAVARRRRVKLHHTAGHISTSSANELKNSGTDVGAVSGEAARPTETVSSEQSDEELFTEGTEDQDQECSTLMSEVSIPHIVNPETKVFVAHKWSRFGRVASGQTRHRRLRGMHQVQHALARHTAGLDEEITAKTISMLDDL